MQMARRMHIAILPSSTFCRLLARRGPSPTGANSISGPFKGAGEPGQEWSRPSKAGMEHSPARADKRMQSFSTASPEEDGEE